jgi:hypothetical protein
VNDTNQVPLSDADELLLRQVHPNNSQEGRPTSAAFEPGDGDEGKLSVSRNSLISPKDAYNRHVSGKNLPSLGVWGVTNGECTANELSVIPDPIVDSDPIPDDAHALILFGALGSRARKTKARKLAGLARERGIMYPPAADRTGG